MNLGHIKQLLAEHDIRLTKSLGQNFMHDANQIRRIVDCAGLSPGDHVLEIGPGLGPLTEALLERGCTVLAIEKDARLADVLARRIVGNPRFTLQIADAVAFLRDNARPETDWTGWSVVANLPYSVASVILVDLAIHPKSPRQIVCTLQAEVGRRILARPGTSEYGLLTLFIALRYRCDSWFRVSPGCFFPAPNVDSLCLRLVKRPDPILSPDLEKLFRDVVRRGFSQRRKMIRNLLRSDWPTPAILEGLDDAGTEADARAEALDLSQFAILTESLARSRRDGASAS